MDHKELLASLTPDQRLAMTARSDWPGLWYLGAHFGAILGLGAAIWVGVPFWGALLPLQGILIVFTFTLLHETVHDTPFASAGLNRWAGRVAGFLLALPPLWFRYFHLAHHRWTNDPARDPELAEGKPDGWRAYLAYLSGLPVWWSHLTTLWRNARGGCRDAFVPEGARARVTREARWMLALYAPIGVAMVAEPRLLWAWPIPALLGQPFLRAYLLAEHGRCPPVANML
ncbi:MAG: fatty acid desaturase, partial [Pseudomonadota bacterium]